MCGDCVLDKTAGICPVTTCPKGLLNGPCGGMWDGMCEVLHRPRVRARQDPAAPRRAGPQPRRRASPPRTTRRSCKPGAVNMRDEKDEAE